MFGFAQRINPRRSFLFVSKVLGRHIPVKPSTMRKTYKLLASQIPGDVVGPVLFVGMAETAVGLGAGVHQQWMDDNGRDDVVYICTTRHSLGAPLVCEFQEEHSHATRHLIHVPSSPNVNRLMESAKTLILVDDEASTGKTFGNLYSALPDALKKNITRVVLVTLTDWSVGAAERVIDKDVQNVSILAGSYSWTPNGSVAPSLDGPGLPLRDGPLISPNPDSDWGRLGVDQHLIRIQVPFEPEGKTLVLGTGENVWQPFLLAEHIESLGADVQFSSVTRSPISIGHVIRRKFAFEDNYGGHVPNYLYNVDPAEYSRVYLCSETERQHISPILIEALKNPHVVVG
ncbi:hypothetical protein GUK36_22480 [Rhizobium leguminosarum]|uniref:Phosphoribosyltransferase n=2 Tax=Rhizobium leguminosarum TaxID=384 RepID=A0A6P0DLT8_RHILE|nr:hypothetical protein [Rhizobium leguminosarum]